MARISRDPLARTELHRERIWVKDYVTCRWCGQQPRTRTGKPYLYLYEVQHDSGASSPILGEFCRVGCMRAYHGMD